MLFIVLKCFLWNARQKPLDFQPTIGDNETMTTYIVEVDQYGNEHWFNENDQLHRENDEPAVIWNDGTKEWFINGQRHRDNDKPAVIHPNGTKEWWVNDQLHRDNDKPAIIFSSGRKEWWVNDQLHRDNDEPAIIRPDGRKQWYKNSNRYYPEQKNECDGKIVEIEGKRYKLQLVDE